MIHFAQVARFDADKLARTLRSKLAVETSSSGGGGGGRQFNWALLGSECGICFNAAPSGVRFLAGSIDAEGTYWFGTRKGVFVQGKEKIGPLAETDPFFAFSSTAIERGPDGSIWLGAMGGGIARYQGGQLDRLHSDP